eukprot:jgi/Bigna1/50991/estExt_Genewise1.C_1040006
MMRVKDPKASVKFYQEKFGMTLMDNMDFPSMKFSLYFLASVPKGEANPPKPGTKEARKYLWSYPGTTLELTHNWGTEKEEGQVYHAGNGKGDGFGHIAFACDDVYKSCEELEKQGVSFKKKPDEGRMKGLAFAYDPDGYWGRNRETPNSLGGKGICSFHTQAGSTTMLRVKDPKKSVEFYTKYMGWMTCISEKHFEKAKFSLFFLGN